jgi:DNA replication protein DnaC
VCELYGREIFRQRHCDACTEEKQRSEALALAAEAARRVGKIAAAKWARICPPLYQDTDRARLPQDILSLVMEWRYGPRGVVLYGETGKQKTRLMFQLLRREFEAGRKIIAFGASDFRLSAARAAMDGDAEEWIHRAATADLFYFDDLGQMKMTESSEESLLTVIEKRAGNMLPIMATTQYVGEAFTSQFTRQERGAAILRRIREFCQIIAL